MKLDPDDIRLRYVNEGMPFFQACGKAIKETKQIILDHLIDGGKVMVFFGSPGSGKSWIMEKLHMNDPKTLWVEVSGCNTRQNIFLRKTPGIEFIMVWAPFAICVRRIMSRVKELDTATGKEDLLRLAKTWHGMYNKDGTGNSIYCLKPTRAFYYTEDKNVND